MADAPFPRMRWIPGGEFRMGGEGFYPEEGPVTTVGVDGFWMDESPVTVEAFAAFVEDTGHVTFAEIAPDPADYPGADPELLVPGSLVFRPTRGPVDLRDVRNWWHWTPGATWRAPEGPGSDVRRRGRHPVTQVTHADAAAYARWAGKSLPTEAEWERAARGGLDGAVYAWGDDPEPGGREMANFWRGEFPWQRLGDPTTTRVGSYPANGYGLRDVTGNVWEWTDDFFTPKHPGDEGKSCCVPQNPRVVVPDASLPADGPGAHIPRRVVKGGSHLCAANYCLRYRPAARQAESIDTSTGHIGFRCIVRGAPGP